MTMIRVCHCCYRYVIDMSYHSLSVLSRKYSHGVKAMLRLHLSSTAEKERRPVAGARYAIRDVEAIDRFHFGGWGSY